MGQEWNIKGVDLGLVSNVVRSQHLQDFVLRDATVLRGLPFMMENVSPQLPVHVSIMEKSSQLVQKQDKTVITGSLTFNMHFLS